MPNTPPGLVVPSAAYGEPNIAPNIPVPALASLQSGVVHAGLSRNAFVAASRAAAALVPKFSTGANIPGITLLLYC